MATENVMNNQPDDEFSGMSANEIRESAEQGNFRASRRLGNMYSAGEGVEKDEAEASKWWKFADRQHHEANIRAAENGDVEAQFDLGMEYVWGSWTVDENPVEYNQQEARKWFRLAAEQGHAEAQYELGMLYSVHGGWPNDSDECQKWVCMAAEQGDSEALERLGHMYASGEDAPQDYVEAVKWYRRAAEQLRQLEQPTWGYCLLSLGNIYASGRPGVPQDEVEATKWYRRFVDSGGLAYWNINFGPDDKVSEEQIKFVQLLAADGHSESQYQLGVLLERDNGVSKNLAEAEKWYGLASAQGHVNAQYRLGLMYESGEGVIQDDTRALEQFTLAAEQGHVAAQNNLGVLYSSGRGAKLDHRKAAKWFRLAAKQGAETAQYNLGLMYEQGCGFLEDKDKAAKWYGLAAKQGYPWAYLARGLLLEDLDDLKRAAVGLFILHQSADFGPLRDAKEQIEAFKSKVAILIAKKENENAASEGRRNVPAHEMASPADSLGNWNIAITLNGMLELIASAADISSAEATLKRAFKGGDPLAGYYLAILADRNPSNLSMQREAMSHLEKTQERLQPYGDPRRVLGKDTEPAREGYYDKEFETLLFGLARQKHSEIKLALATDEAHKRTLSFLTHTLNNALSTGPETVRTVIEILGSDLYDKGQEEYKAINNMASLFPVFLFAESLLKTFKLYVSDPEQIRGKWKNDKAGDANVSLVLAMALRQSVARFVFSSNHLAQLKRLLPGQDKEAIKKIRKSFVDAIIPLEINVRTVGNVFEWIKAHFGVLEVRIDANAEISFTSNATRYMFFFAAFSELIYNALKYSDGQQPILVKWFRLGDDYCFSCANSCQPAGGGQSLQEGSNKGLNFIDKLMAMLENSTLCSGAEGGEYRALLTFGHENFGEGAA